MAEDSTEVQAQTTIENESSVDQVLDSEQEKRRKKLLKAQYISLAVGAAGSITALIGRFAKSTLTLDIGAIFAVIGVVGRAIFGAKYLKFNDETKNGKNS